VLLALDCQEGTDALADARDRMSSWVIAKRPFGAMDGPLRLEAGSLTSAKHV